MKSCWLAVSLVAWLPLAAAAQQTQIRGVALDEQTREPLAAVAIHLIDATGNRLLAVLTDAQGRFQITAPGPGRYRVRGERIGYFASQTPELYGAALNQLVELRMSPRPVRLDSILVSARSEARPLRVGEQLIHGRMIDEETHATIPGATIELYSKGKRLSSTIADANGLFRIVTPIPGAYTLQAQRIGYKTADSPELKLVLGDTIRLDFYLSARAVLLAPIIVTGSAREWLVRREQNGMEEFNNRLKRYGNSAFGDFITRDSLAGYERDGFSTRRIIELHQFKAPLGCTPGVDVYVNGAPFLVDTSATRNQGMMAAYAQAIDDAFAPGGLEAIEFYTAPSIPGEFSIPRLLQRGAGPGKRYGPPCNVIALWTRR